MKRSGFTKLNIYMVVGLLLIASSLAWLFYNLWDDARAKREVESTLALLKAAQVFDSLGQENNESVKQDGDSLNGDVFFMAEEREIPDYQLNEDMAMPSLFIKGLNYVGLLQIPNLGLELPVLDEWNYDYLKIAPCRYKGSPYKDKFTIMAHNYTSHFASLQGLHPSDTIIFTDMDGNVFRYSVVELEVLKESQLEELEAGEWNLTLFSCLINDTQRIVVRGVLEE